MKVIKFLLIVIVLAVAGAFAYGLTPAHTLHVERSATISAPACAIYAQLDNYRNFAKWSPWEHKDPNMQKTVEGPFRGAGAKQSWSGNKEVGRGSQEILETKNCALVKSKLVFGDFPDHRYVSAFELTPGGDATTVRWTLDGEYGGNLLNQV